MCRLLINRGASVLALTGDGCTPLHLAARSNMLACADELVAAGARIDMPNKGEPAAASRRRLSQQLRSLLFDRALPPRLPLPRTRSRPDARQRGRHSERCTAATHPPPPPPPPARPAHAAGKTPVDEALSDAMREMLVERGRSRPAAAAAAAAHTTIAPLG
jgi:hypothetical protein